MEVSIARVESTSLPDGKIKLNIAGTAPQNNRVEVSFNQQSSTKKLVNADGSGNFMAELTIPSWPGGNHKVFAKLIDHTNAKTNSMDVPPPSDNRGGERQEIG